MVTALCGPYMSRTVSYTVGVSVAAVREAPSNHHITLLNLIMLHW